VPLARREESDIEGWSVASSRWPVKRRNRRAEGKNISGGVEEVSGERLGSQLPAISRQPSASCRREEERRVGRAARAVHAGNAVGNRQKMSHAETQ